MKDVSGHVLREESGSSSVEPSGGNSLRCDTPAVAAPLYPTRDRVHEVLYSPEALSDKLPEQTLYGYLRTSNSDNLPAVAFSYLGTDITYKNLFFQIERVARSLRAAGIGRGDFVSVVSPGIPEAFYVVYACSMIGAVANMIDPRYPAQGIAHQVHQVGSRFVIGLMAAAPLLLPLQKEGISVVVVAPSESLGVSSKLSFLTKALTGAARLPKKPAEASLCTSWRAFLEEGRKVPIVSDCYEKDAPVAALSTGGTTGMPKKVLLSNDNINAAVFQAARCGLTLSRNQSWYDIMPPFIAYGLADGLHLPLVIGMKVYLVPDPKAIDLAEEMLRLRPNHMAGAPDHWLSLADSEKLEGADLSFLVDPTLGGDGISLAQERRINDFFASHGCTHRLSVGYGMTECCGGASVAGANEHAVLQSVGYSFPQQLIATFERRPDGTVGKELPYVPEDVPDPVSEEYIGEICFSGPSVMLGYYDDPEETANALRVHDDGRTWLHSGDAGYLRLPKGEVHITGRYKDFIVRHDGFKIPPQEIEEVVYRCDAVEVCKAVGIPDKAHPQGELVKVFFKVKEGPGVGAYTTVEDRVREICEEHLPAYKLPCAYEELDAFPKTSIGKIDLKALRQIEGVGKDES